MANICEYYITVKGPEERLWDVVAFLMPVVEDLFDNKGWDSSILHVDELFPDVDPKTEHSFVRLDDQDVGGLWFGMRRDICVVTPKELEEFKSQRETVERLGLESFLATERGHQRFSNWLKRERGKAKDRPNAAVLLLSGASKWAPPGGLVERLSRLYPDLEFEFGGTTEHELYEHYVCKNGMVQRIHHQVDRIQAEYSVVYVADGVVLNPPEYVFNSNPDDEFIEFGDGVKQGDDILDGDA